MALVEDRRRQRSSLTAAWVCLGLVPVGWLAAVFLGYGLYAMLGYPDGAGSPWWVDVIVVVVTWLPVVLPCVGAVVLGRRARVEGARAGMVPLVLGAVVGTAWVLFGVISLLWNWLALNMY